jgi:hypothetical protein
LTNRDVDLALNLKNRGKFLTMELSFISCFFFVKTFKNFTLCYDFSTRRIIFEIINSNYVDKMSDFEINRKTLKIYSNKQIYNQIFEKNLKFKKKLKNILSLKKNAILTIFKLWNFFKQKILICFHEIFRKFSFFWSSFFFIIIKFNFNCRGFEFWLKKSEENFDFFDKNFRELDETFFK